MRSRLGVCSGVGAFPPLGGVVGCLEKSRTATLCLLLSPLAAEMFCLGVTCPGLKTSTLRKTEAGRNSPGTGPPAVI